MRTVRERSGGKGQEKDQIRWPCGGNQEIRKKGLTNENQLKQCTK